ncbi:lipase member H-A-like [Oppia nitens]|uniref:lipase member H-A-like n=1 Tax=Oppia nitens TaxID=1686743 RepID=UPI0023DB29D6|nr:lipase member H-A-like [Oppia nitens]
MNPLTANVSFSLFTNESTDGQVFSFYGDTSFYKQLAKSKIYSSEKRTVIIVHGYTDYFDDCNRYDDDNSTTCAWMANIKNYFLDYDYNVIAVDWREPANSLNYFNSAFNTQIVGAMVAEFIKKLIDIFGAKPQDFHLIGHSLGAQVCGFAGKRFNDTKIGQITGLDPAGPGFSSYRLSPDDATLVKVLHTSAGLTKNVDDFIGENPLESIQLFGWLGCDDSLGHFDFWPNGGNGQRGCEKILSLNELFDLGLSGLKYKASCDHSRATELPLNGYQRHKQLMPNDCQMIGYQCDNNGDFADGKCGDCGDDNSRCMPLEFMPEFWTKSDNWVNAVVSYPRNLFLRTTDKMPFCLFHYQILISIGNNFNAGLITIRLTGLKSIQISLNSFITGFTSGKNYTYLYTGAESLGQINEATVQIQQRHVVDYLQRANLFRSKKYRNRNNGVQIDAIYVNYMSNSDKRIRDQYSSQLMPEYESSTNNKYQLLFRL